MTVRPDRAMPGSPASPSGSTPGAALMGLRGVAALIVVAHHLLLQLGPVDGPLMGVELRGYLAVDVFFILSGFVLARAYGTWFADGGTVREYAVFMSRRVARVWPLHTAILAILLLDGTVRHTGNFWPREVLTNLLLLQGWGFSQTVITPAWSVSTEVLAYALFPLLAGVALRRGRRLAWAGLVGAVAVLALAVLASPGAPGQRGALDLHQNWSLLPALRCLAGFSIGLLTWRALQDRRVWSWAAHRSAPGGVLAVFAVLLLAAAPDLALYACFPLLIASLYASQGLITQTLSRGVFQSVGRGSYALYLVHYPLLGLAVGLVGGPRFVPVFLALLVPAVLAAYWLVERPAQAALRRWSAVALAPVSGLAAR